MAPRPRVNVPSIHIRRAARTHGDPHSLRQSPHWPFFIPRDHLYQLTGTRLPNHEELESLIRAVDAQYNLGSGFLAHIYKEDDWSFVIKAHALIEAAVSQLLTHHVGDTRLSRVFERLELSNPDIGRLAFVKAFGLLDENERRFVRSFSELRNRLVHNVHNVRFTFQDHLAMMDSMQRSAFLDWITYYANPGPAKEALRGEAQKSTKRILWTGLMFFVLTCLDKTNEARSRHDQIRRALDIIASMEEDYGYDWDEGDPPPSKD